MIFYLCPGSPDTISGGTRKLYDHVAILQNHGYDAKIIYNHQVTWATPDDLIVVPEVYGDGIRDFIPRGIPRIVFVQNPYLTDHVDGLTIVHGAHPYLTTPELGAVFTESQHTTDLLRARFPDLRLIRTHSSGNGRNGKDAGFHYGPWPRAKRVVYFDYKHERVNDKLFSDLDLPEGWTVETMTGMTDEQITEQMATSAIFAAANQHEGMCAPTSEAMISGAAIVCWTGGGPDEYLSGRAVVAAQDDVDALRLAIEATARSIDAHPRKWPKNTRAWSDWFQATYSRQGEITELCAIFDGLL